MNSPPVNHQTPLRVDAQPPIPESSWFPQWVVKPALVVLVVTAAMIPVVVLLAGHSPTERELLAARIHTVAPAPGTPVLDLRACWPDVEPRERCRDKVAHYVVYDENPTRGAATCLDAIRGQLGAGCVVRGVNRNPAGGPLRYVEYDDNTDRGTRKCEQDLLHDRNPRAECTVLPTIQDTTVAAG